MTGDEIKRLIADNQTKKAIQGLLEAAQDPDLKNEVVLQSAKYNDYLREKAAGTKSQENLDIQKANIDAALMYIADKLPSSPAPSSINLPLTPAKLPRWLLFAGAGLSIAILAIILFYPDRDAIRPAGGDPFEFTVSLLAPKMPDYPPIEGAMIQIKLDNRWDDAPVDEFGDADFKGIPPQFAQKMIPFRLQSEYWEQLQDSILLDGKSASVEVRPNGVLAMITGTVRTSDASDFLQGVEIRLENSPYTVQTNPEGYFELAVPPHLQKERYSISVSKSGFAPQNMFVHPIAGSIDIRLAPN